LPTPRPAHPFAI